MREWRARVANREWTRIDAKGGEPRSQNRGKLRAAAAGVASQRPALDERGYNRRRGGLFGPWQGRIALSVGCRPGG